MPRLRRVDCSEPGFARRRRGRGFEYLDSDGSRLTDQATLERIGALAIPPAWKDVWICPLVNGHLQATGVDDAGRKQYRYHDAWRTRRDAEKFEFMLEFGEALPAFRRKVLRDLKAGDELTQTKVLACAARLLDVGFFRIGSESYAEDNDSFGLATIRKEHVSRAEGSLVFDYPGKSGQRRVHEIVDPSVADVVDALRRRRGGGDELLAYREGRRWRDLRSDDVNEYLKRVTGGAFTAKAFRTWNGTVLAAVAIADEDRPKTKTARRRSENNAVKAVAAYLGNTPAVARSAYIDPRVFDRYASGKTIAPVIESLGGKADLARPKARERVEAAVLDLLS